MRSKLFLLTQLLLASSLMAQTPWYLLGNLGTNPATDYVGTQNNNELILRTDAIQRLRLNNTVTTTINGYGATAKNGFLGLSPNGGLWSTGPGAFSRLHLDDGIFPPLTGPYRPWMRNGVYMSGNNDMMYVGQLFRAGEDESDAVIAWGDNKYSPAGPDHLRFLFMGSGYEGEEVSRINGDGFFGIGNFDAAGQDPNERLDLINRTIRLRDFTHPTLYRNDNYDRILVANPTDGRVYWRPASSLVTQDCDWVVQTPNPHVSSVYDPSNCAWNMKYGVGVGVQTPKFKLHVLHTSDALLAPTAIYGESRFDYENASWVTGVHGRAGTSSMGGPLLTMRAFGVIGDAFTARSSVGVYGYADVTQAQGGTNATETFGVMGFARANENSDFCVGVWGTASGATDPLDNWAGWFEGNVNIQGGDLYINEVYQISDASLKTNIEEAPPSLGVVEALDVRSFEFNADAVTNMHLPSGSRVGLIAQEVEEVLPQLVSEVHVPAKYDSTLTVVQESYSYKTVNYVGLIPYLLGAVQQLAADNQQLREQISACCASDGSIDQRSIPSDAGATEGQERVLQIQPNPFNERTTMYYTLDRSGRMQLMANSADGKQLRVLSEANLEAGQYQFEWITTDLAPGIYYVTLLLDGEPIVKKAVKVRM